ncbi:MAG: hypothetical protein NT041_01230 [Candidatus Vogelbacteria bacterium]|nr:hypothetical protein [Candidatus Vogelbacteria bacterium]
MIAEQTNIGDSTMAKPKIPQEVIDLLGEIGKEKECDWTWDQGSGFERDLSLSAARALKILEILQSEKLI